MAQDAPELAAHKEWLGQIQQVGLVVSPHVLVRHNVFVDRQKSLEIQARLADGVAPSGVAVALGRRSATSDETAPPAASSFPDFATSILDWPADLLLGRPGGPSVPATLDVALTEHDEVLSADYAVPDPEQPDALPLALVKVLPEATDFDKLPDGAEKGWRATPHARCERLLRETKVPIGLLFNGADLRLLYAPAGESSGHLTFRLKELVQTMGRPMAGALHALLGEVRVTDALPEAQRLPALLRESRRYQNEVSTQLADQVLEALWELVRGFQRANEEAGGALLAEVLREQPNEVYGGLLSTLMRLVFVLYAEDRALMPAGETYQKHYAISGLFERLREDEARYPDTMDARYGAWAQLLALFRLIHDGGSHGSLRFPARHGRLFDPDAYPFLEGRPHGSTRVKSHLTEGVFDIAQRSAALTRDFGAALGEHGELKALLLKNPIQAWTGGWAKSGTRYFSVEQETFSTAFTVEADQRESFQVLARELVEWRLAEYLDRANVSGEQPSEFTCRVSHADGKPIIFLPSGKERLLLPSGETDLWIEGTRYAATFAKIAVNAVRSSPDRANELPAILRGWFGGDAGLPGTRHVVTLFRVANEWHLARSTPKASRAVRWAQYSREEIPALFGMEFSTAIWNVGYVRRNGHIVLLITLEKDALPSNFQYADRFIAPDVLEWHSQNRTSRDSTDGRAIQRHHEDGTPVHLFVRRGKRIPGGGASPFYFCGDVTFEAWEGDRPITIRWRLEEAVPLRLREPFSVPGGNQA